MLNIDSEFKNGFMFGWEESKEQALEPLRGYYSTEEDIIATIHAIYDLTLKAKPSYDSEQNRIFFKDDAELNIYNELVGKMSQLALKESKYLETITNNYNAALDKISTN